MKKTNQDKPYEKFLRIGPKYLTDTELLAIIIRTGTGEMDATEIAAQILHGDDQQEGLLCLHHMSVEQLMQFPGIGEVKAVRLKCIAELSNRIACSTQKDKVDFCTPQLVASYYMEQMRHLETEQVLCIMLDNKSRLITDLTISTGTVNCSLVSPREIFLKALEYHAVYIMLLHNHPSGDPAPSREDVVITQKMREAGEFLNIPLLDHIIIGDRKYLSFREHEML